jgi:hypothetical protein
MRGGEIYPQAKGRGCHDCEVRYRSGSERGPRSEMNMALLIAADWRPCSALSVGISIGIGRVVLCYWDRREGRSG